MTQEVTEGALECRMSHQVLAENGELLYFPKSIKRPAALEKERALKSAPVRVQNSGWKEKSGNNSDGMDYPSGPRTFHDLNWFAAHTDKLVISDCYSLCRKCIAIHSKRRVADIE